MHASNFKLVCTHHTPPEMEVLGIDWLPGTQTYAVSHKLGGQQFPPQLMFFNKDGTPVKKQHKWKLVTI